MASQSLRHTDGTPCQGQNCAWQGAGGHATLPLKTCCPSCGRDDRLFDLDRVTQMSSFTFAEDGSPTYGDTDLIMEETTTVGVYCRSCDWSATWGEKHSPDEDDLARYLVTKDEFEASREANENAKIEQARREALLMLRASEDT